MRYREISSGRRIRKEISGYRYGILDGVVGTGHVDKKIYLEEKFHELETNFKNHKNIFVSIKYFDSRVKEL